MVGVVAVVGIFAAACSGESVETAAQEEITTDAGDIGEVKSGGGNSFVACKQPLAAALHLGCVNE